MASEEPDRFPTGVAERLKTYVYRLIDPRNGETFYVGKGRGNRLFEHVREMVDSDDPGNKVRRIREIRNAGFEVAHVIHRHGLDEKTALEVEAAMIDAYPGLTNAVVGIGSYDFGVMHVREIIARYSAKAAVFRHKAMLISVNKTAADSSLYEAVRFAWKINVKKASASEIVLPTVQGLIVGAFIAEKWLPATPENFPGREEVPGRYGFRGRTAPATIAQLYVGRRVPDEFRRPGAANPVKYTWAKA